jgi:hypothetical protein
MTAIPSRPVTRDSLFLWVMHRFSEEFADHALLKGGMALRLLDSPRSTTDIDYIFVPFRSKLDIIGRIQEILAELEGAKVEYEIHSRMMRANISMDDVAIQVEAAVALKCPSTAMSTGGFAQQQGQPPQVIRMMSPEVALAHKLAAWNERRLMRDLYDCYFFVARLGVVPDRSTLEERLQAISSRIPALQKRKSMTSDEFFQELRDIALQLSPKALQAELGGLIAEEEMAGLDLRMKAALSKLGVNSR